MYTSDKTDKTGGLAPSRPSLLDIDRLEATGDRMLGVHILGQAATLIFVATNLILDETPLLQRISLAASNALPWIESAQIHLGLVVSTFPVLIIQLVLTSDDAGMSVLALWEACWLGAWMYAIRSAEGIHAQQKLVLAVHMIALLMKMHSFVRSAEYRCKTTKPPTVDHANEPNNSNEKESPSSIDADPLNEQKPKQLSILSNVFEFVFLLFTPFLDYESVKQILQMRYKHLFYYIFWTTVSICALSISINQYGHQTLASIRDRGYIITMIELIPVTMTVFMFSFFAIFEYGMNAVAEILRLDNREFYGDWWNSTGYESFSRTWARNIHLFLRRHVHVEVMRQFGLSRPYAMVLTFLVSSLLMELVMYTAFGSIQTDLFRSQVLQTVYIWMDYMMPASRPSYGIFSFWCGYFFGPPMIAIAYGRTFFE